MHVGAPQSIVEIGEQRDLHLLSQAAVQRGPAPVDTPFVGDSDDLAARVGLETTPIVFLVCHATGD